MKSLNGENSQFGVKLSEDRRNIFILERKSERETADVRDLKEHSRSSTMMLYEFLAICSNHITGTISKKRIFFV